MHVHKVHGSKLLLGQVMDSDFKQPVGRLVGVVEAFESAQALFEFLVCSR
jgi:hypothetical protein